MSTETQTVASESELAVLEFIKTEYEANKPAVLAAIQNAEGGVEGFIVNGIKNAPKPHGLLGTLFGILEPQIEGYVRSLVASFGADVVYRFIDSEINAEIARLQGAK